jgi:hypothetical protein
MSLTKIDLGISVAGHGPNLKDQRYIHITRKDVIERVQKHPAIDPWTKEYLYKRINDYPDSALVFFVQNINQIVVNAINERNRVLKEQHDENRKKETPPATVKVAAVEVPSKVYQPSELQQPSGSTSGEGVVEAGSEEVGGEVEAAEEAPFEEEDRESLFARRASS